jgi:hypothetical protein
VSRSCQGLLVAQIIVGTQAEPNHKRWEEVEDSDEHRQSLVDRAKGLACRNAPRVASDLSKAVSADPARRPRAVELASTLEVGG